MALLNDKDNQMKRRVFDIAQEPCKMLMPIVGYDDMPIVPLEIAVEPLIDILPAVQSHVDAAKQRCENPPPDGLTIDESASIMLYTMGWRPLDKCLYVALSATLRSEDRDKLQPWLLYLKLFLTALSRLPSQAQTVFRGIKLDVRQDYPKDKIITWWGFSSCTTTLDILQSELFLGQTGIRTMFTIACHSGKNIRNHSYIQKENEILILAATQFEIISSLDQGHGLQVVQLKELRSAHPFLNPVVPPPPPPPPPTPDTTIIVDNQMATQPGTTAAVSLPNSQTIQTVLLKACNQLIINLNKTTNHQQQPVSIPYQNLKLEETIKRCNALSTVELSEQNLIDKDMPIVVEKAIIEKKCKELCLTSNKITFDGAWILAEALKNNKTLQDLSLWNNLIYDNGVMCIVQVLSINNYTLKILNLGKNGITDIGAGELAEMLRKNQTLTELYLGENDISDNGVQILAESIEKYNTTLEILSLISNQLVTNRCVTHLNQMIMHNNTLKQLLLDNCNLSTKGKQTLQMAQQNKINFAVYAK